MGLVGSTLVTVVYVWLQQRRLHTPWETVRSGIHVRVAAWAAEKAGRELRPERAWAPELLIPIESIDDTDRLLELGSRLTGQAGSIRLVGMHGNADLDVALKERAETLRDLGTPTTSTCVDAMGFARGATLVIDAVRGMFLGPNLVLLDGEVRSEKELQIVVDHCIARSVGMGVLAAHPDGALGRARDVTVWLSERSPDWSLEMHNVNLDLPVLAAHLLSRIGGGRLRLATVVRAIEDRADANLFLMRLIDQGRLAQDTEIFVAEGDFVDALRESPYADIHIFGISTVIEKQRLLKLRDACGGACLFLLDSGQESILA